MIFISYARDDLDLARELERQIKQWGYTVLRDPALVEGDPFWRDSLRNAFNHCSAMIVLWSQSASNSPWIEQEVRGFTGPKAYLNSNTAPPPPLKKVNILTNHTLQVWIAKHNKISNNGYIVKGDLVAENSLKIIREERILQQKCSLLEFQARLIQHSGFEVNYLDNDCNKIILHDGSVLNRLPGKSKSHIYVSIKPINNIQYQNFIQETGLTPSPTWLRANFRLADAPVVGVTWFEARAYATFLGADLPTESEWLQAACSGFSNKIFSTTDGRISKQLAYYGRRFGIGNPTSTNRFAPNPTGFFGMSGNTWDWCFDSEGSHKVIRGGGYMDTEKFCRLNARYRNSPIDRDCCVGFRLKFINN